MKRIFVVALILFGFVSAAEAGDPDPSFSWVEPWDSYGQAFVSPGGGGDTLLVWVRDDFGAACPGVRVEIDLSDCTTLCVDCPNGLTAMTDANGMAVLNARVGGCEDCIVRVMAGGVEIRTYFKVTSADWNGFEADGRVDVQDLQFFALHVPPEPYDACADYNGNGVIDVSDQALIAISFTQSNDYPCDAGLACEMTPHCLDFSTVTVGDSVAMMFTITNNTGSLLSGFASENSDHYRIEPDPPYYDIFPGGTWDFWVWFVPDTTGTQTCFINLDDGVCDSLFCTGFGEGPPDCRVEPDTLDFGPVPVGNAREMTFTITNTGGQFLSGAANIVEPTLDYSIVPPGDEPYIIPGEDSLVVTVSFAPVDMGITVCTINTGDSLCGEVLCTGEGYYVGDPDPALSTVEPWDSIGHAFVCPGTGGADTLMITVLDDMGVPCAYSPVEIDLMDCSNLCIDSPAALSGTADADGVVYLDPRVGGCEYCAVVVRANGFEIRSYPLINSADWDGIWGDGVVDEADSLYLYGQAGTSDPCADYDGDGIVGLGDFGMFHECSGLSNTVTCPYSCEVVPASILQDTVPVGSWKDTTFTIRNTGSKTLVGTVSEDCPCDSILSGGGLYSIPGGDSLVVAVRFEPDDVLNYFCTVETGDSICADFLWWGVGGDVPPVCAVTPDTLNFGSVVSGSWRDTTFTITNTGGGSLTGTVLDTCGYYHFVPPGDISYTLAGGDSLVVTARFTPPDTGTYDCTIETGDALCTDVSCTGVGVEPPPACVVMPDTLDYGGVFVGSWRDTTFTIRNTGGGSLTGTVLDTCDFYDFVPPGDILYTLAGGDSLVVTVRFTPPDTGTYDCTIETGDALCTDVACTGVGLAPPTCLVVPDSLDVGSVFVGSWRDTVFTIVNTGGGTLSGVVTEACDHYRFVPPGDIPYTLAGGDSLIVTVRFEPGATGTHVCMIETGDSLCTDVLFSGVGLTPPACQVAPDTLDFGALALGSTKDTTFTIKNIGGGTLSGTVSETCYGFSFVPPGDIPYTLAGGESLVVAVRYEPTDTLPQFCTIETGDSLCVDVWCTGVGEVPPVCLVAPDTVDFGSVFVGSWRDTTFTITNIGGGTLSGIVSETCNHYDFVPPGDIPYTLAGGESLVVTVRFEPAATGIHVCVIETGDSLCTDVSITGAGLVSAACQVVPDTLDFGTVAVGSTRDTTFTIKNTGGGILSGTVSETCAHYSLVPPGDIPYSLAGGESLVVTVRFEPTVEGIHPCTIETGDAFCADVALTGEAGPEPIITSIADVGNDQGRWVRIRFLKSPRDALGSPTPITEYAIFRRIDEVLVASLAAAGSEEGSLGKAASLAKVEPEAFYPPGDWDFIVTIPADAEDEYASVVPTLKDSTIVEGMYYTTFFVRARTATPGVYFDSQPDSGYSVDNLAPGVPQGFVVTYLTGSGNQLEWNPSEDEDFDFFRIYRGSSPDFTPGSGNLVDATTATSWTDPTHDGRDVYYKLTAVDFSGNESDAAYGEPVTGVEPTAPDRYALYQNVPNPFNPTTVIRYDVPVGGGQVTLRVYDVRGRHVQTLVDGMRDAGRKEATWNARDSSGRRVASGVYFYRLVAPGFEETRKMVLLQ